MSEVVRVYGFGSYFTGTDKPRDIDLLMIHKSVDKASCEFAITCKCMLIRHLPMADIVLLSEQEAEQNCFIARSSAVPIGHIESEEVAEQVSSLVQSIKFHRSPSQVHPR